MFVNTHPSFAVSVSGVPVWASDAERSGLGGVASCRVGRGGPGLSEPRGCRSPGGEHRRHNPPRAHGLFEADEQIVTL